jgi:hypothetical protein
MKTTIVQIPTPITGELVDYVIIDRGNDEFTSMPKSEYDRQQAMIDEAKTK